MATGSVSALDQDTWQLIQTNTTTSGTTSTFSGLSGYKEYLVAFEGVSTSSSANIKLTFNSSSSNYYGGSHLQYSNGNVENATSSIYCNNAGYNNALNGIISIKNVKNGAPKIVKGENLLSGGGNYPSEVSGGWTDISEITSITFTTSAGSFSAGSMKLYGIAG